jgi:hypothetical protein
LNVKANWIRASILQRFVQGQFSRKIEARSAF